MATAAKNYAWGNPSQMSTGNYGRDYLAALSSYMTSPDVPSYGDGLSRQARGVGLNMPASDAASIGLNAPAINPLYTPSDSLGSSLAAFGVAPPAIATPEPTNSGWGWLNDLLSPVKQLAQDSGFVGYKDANGNEIAGWGGDVLKGLMGFGSLINGRQQLALAKENLAMNKDLAYKNFNNQRTMVNSQLADRQRSRVSADPTHYESVDSYMSKNRVV